jgi:uncharacterized membrane protein YfcA
LGAFLGSLVAAKFNASLLKVLFAIYTFVVAFQILNNHTPNPGEYYLPGLP